MAERPTAGPRPQGEPGDAPRPCPHGECDGGGLIVDEETNTARPCVCRGRLIGRAATRRTRSVIPRVHRNVSFERPPLSGIDPGMRQHVERYVAGLDDNLRHGRGLWFHGDDDEASAALAMLVARKALEGGWSVAIYSVGRLLAELRATFESDSPDSYLALFERVCAVDLLVLTDLGAQRQTEWVAEQLHSLVNERWQDCRAIVATSALPDADGTDVEQALAAEVARLKATRSHELEPILARLERLVAELGEVEPKPWSDMGLLRRQLGARTVERLEAICDGPMTLSKPTWRISAAG